MEHKCHGCFHMLLSARTTGCTSPSPEAGPGQRLRQDRDTEITVAFWAMHGAPCCGWAEGFILPERS